MAHSEGHSSTERTILWIIIPATILVSLYFTWQSKKHDQLITKTELSGDLSDVMKKEEKAPAKVVIVADTLTKDTVTVPEVKAVDAPTQVKHDAGH